MSINLYTNALFYTGDRRMQECEAIVTYDDRIVATGNHHELKSDFPKAKEFNLGGKRVLPAFTDAHTHFLQYCLHQTQIDLNGITSKAECLKKIREKVHQVPTGQWIKGSGWNQNLWRPAEFPTRKDLDGISKDHPIALDGRDYHSLWVNSKALELARITSATTFHDAGEICKDPNGIPNGIILEEARNLIWDVMGEPTAEDRTQALRAGMRLAHQNGLAGVHCMETIEDFEIYQSMRRNRELKVRVCFYMPARYLDHAVSMGLYSGFGDKWISFGGIKIFMDGTLGSQTAHMLEPFEGSDNYGTEIIDQKTLDDYVQRAAAKDIACAVHAIGDRANRKVLDAFESYRKGFPIKKLRQRIEHCQIIHPSDIPRFGSLGVIASMQAIHIPEDIDTADRYWGDRARHAYPFRSLLDSGANLALGSDMPIETPNIFEGIYAALCRTKRGDTESWHPEETMTLQEIIRAYTMGAAYASGEENTKGSLSPGKVADFMVLSDDLMTSDSAAISKIRVESMIIGGEVVYQE